MRRNIYKRNPEPKAIKLYSTPIYQRILEWVAEYRYVSIINIVSLEHIHSVCFGDKTSICIVTIKNTIRRLYDHKLLEKQPLRGSKYDSLGGDRHIYQLTTKGRDFLAMKTGHFSEDIYVPAIPNKYKVSNYGIPIGREYLMKHHLLITDIVIALKLFCALSNGRYIFKYKVLDKEIELKFKHKKQNFWIKPDAFVIIEDSKTGEREQLFIEADRATEGLKGKFLKKLKGYFAFHESGEKRLFLRKLHDNVPELQSGSEPQKHWISKAKVLTVCILDTRIQNMINATIPEYNKGTGSTMFDFVHSNNFELLSHRIVLAKSSGRERKEPYLDLEKAKQLGSDIYRYASSKRSGYHGLFDSSLFDQKKFDLD